MPEPRLSLLFPGNAEPGNSNYTIGQLNEYQPERTNMGLLEMMSAGLMYDTPSRRAAGIDPGLLANFQTPSLNRQPLVDGRLANTTPNAAPPAPAPAPDPVQQIMQQMEQNSASQGGWGHGAGIGNSSYSDGGFGGYGPNDYGGGGYGGFGGIY